MIHIVEKNLFDNIPPKSTAKVIRKHFLQCVACPAGNMAQKSVPQSTSTTEYVPGEVLKLNIKVFADTFKARKHLRKFGNHVGALTAVDVVTGNKLAHLLILMLHLKYNRSYSCASMCSISCNQNFTY